MITRALGIGASWVAVWDPGELSRVQCSRAWPPKQRAVEGPSLSPGQRICQSTTSKCRGQRILPDFWLFAADDLRPWRVPVRASFTLDPGGTGTGENAQSALAALSARNLNSGQNSTNVPQLYRTKNAFTEIQINFFGLQVVILQCIVFVPHRPSRLFGLSIHSYTETSYDGSPEIDACFALTASSR